MIGIPYPQYLPTAPAQETGIAPGRSSQNHQHSPNCQLVGDRTIASAI